MLKNYRILTVTHKTTNTDDIAEFIIPTDNKDILSERLNELREQYGLNELMYLATCNRVLFFFVSHTRPDEDFITSFFQSINPTLSTSITEKVLYFEGQAAICHLYEIAASVDSMVVGEREIFRQLREAYEACNSYKLTGDNIRIAMRATVEVAKEVYAQTRIGEKPVSVVSLAFRKLQEQTDLSALRFLMVGAGKTNQLFAKFMLKYDYGDVTVFNRSLANAQALANELKGTAFSLDELKNYRSGFDVLVVCTAAIEPIITKDIYQKINIENTPKIVIDLSLPRNVSDEVVENFDIEYIDIEKLRQLAKENMAFRLNEVDKARKLIGKRVEEFKMRFRQRQIERAMSDVPTQIKAIKSHAIGHVFKNEIDKLNPEARELVERMMDYMEKRCISIPMVAVKDAYRKLHKRSELKNLSKDEKG